MAGLICYTDIQFAARVIQHSNTFTFIIQFAGLQLFPPVSEISYISADLVTNTANTSIDGIDRINSLIHDISKAIEALRDRSFSGTIIGNIVIRKSHSHALIFFEYDMVIDFNTKQISSRVFAVKSTDANIASIIDVLFMQRDHCMLVLNKIGAQELEETIMAATALLDLRGVWPHRDSALVQ